MMEADGEACWEAGLSNSDNLDMMAVSWFDGLS